MKINNKVNSIFEAEINNIKFLSSDLYYCVLIILNYMNSNFDVNLKDEFILDLSDAIKQHYDNTGTNFDEIQYKCLNSIDRADSFEKIMFDLNNELKAVKTLNTNIKNKYYILNP